MLLRDGDLYVLFLFCCVVCVCCVVLRRVNLKCVALYCVRVGVGVDVLSCCVACVVAVRVAGLCCGGLCCSCCVVLCCRE